MADLLETLIDSLDRNSERVLNQLEQAKHRIQSLTEENVILRQQLQQSQALQVAGSDALQKSTTDDSVEATAQVEYETDTCNHLSGKLSTPLDSLQRTTTEARSLETGSIDENNASDEVTDLTKVATEGGQAAAKDDRIPSSPWNGETSPQSTEQEYPEDMSDISNTEKVSSHDMSTQERSDLDLSAADSDASREQAPSPQALLKEWYKRYPNAFFKAHTCPLKVGIHKDLIEREPWPAKLIRRALANYVNLPRYLKSVRVGMTRVDLDGQPAGDIGEEDVRHAKEQLELLHKRRTEREQRSAEERMNRKIAQLNERLGH